MNHISDLSDKSITITLALINATANQPNADHIVMAKSYYLDQIRTEILEQTQTEVLARNLIINGIPEPNQCSETYS